MSTYSTEILKVIRFAFEQYKIGCDTTFKSVVKAVTPKGYVILDNSGVERTVKCAIPNVTISTGKNVWVKIPGGNINLMHICGIAQK